LGAELIPLELPNLPSNDISFLLSVESAAAFDELTRSGKDDLMVRQIKMLGQMLSERQDLFQQ